MRSFCINLPKDLAQNDRINDERFSNHHSKNFRTISLISIPMNHLFKFMYLISSIVFFAVGFFIIKNSARIQKWELDRYGDEFLQSWRKEESYIYFLKFFGFFIILIGLSCISIAINNFNDDIIEKPNATHNHKN